MDEHAQTVGNFLDGRHAKAAARIAELEAERDEWCAEARLLAGKLMERDAECIAERERREVAEALLRSGYTTAELIAHFARYKD